MSLEIPFDQLENSDLYVDCLYKGSTQGLKGKQGEVLNRLVPGCSNSGGFRRVFCRSDNSRKKIAYVVLFTTMRELEWPDYLDYETGLFRYYGDNR